MKNVIAEVKISLEILKSKETLRKKKEKLEDQPRSEIFLKGKQKVRRKSWKRKDM